MAFPKAVDRAYMLVWAALYEWICKAPLARLSASYGAMPSGGNLTAVSALNSESWSSTAEPVSMQKYCLPKLQLWARYLQYARERRRVRDSDVPITAREVHAMIVFFTCPRPVVLVSVADGGMGNVFPMNLMGPIGNGYFAFALNSTRAAAPLVERAGRVVLSSVPVEQASLAYQLGGNHKKPCVDWNQLPFATTVSTAFGVPVPGFALRVREMQVQATRRIGSHTLFVSRTIRDERWADGTQFFVVHGIYRAWRQKMNRAQPSFPAHVEG